MKLMTKAERLTIVYKEFSLESRFWEILQTREPHVGIFEIYTTRSAVTSR